jgi:hypothetical protein
MPYSARDGDITTVGLVVNDFYQQVLDSCGVGIGICTMGGLFLDCNMKFASWTGFSRRIIQTKTIFGFLDATDIHRAFRLISNLIILASMMSNTLTEEVNALRDLMMIATPPPIMTTSILTDLPMSIMVRGCQRLHQNQVWNI